MIIIKPVGVRSNTYNFKSVIDCYNGGLPTNKFHTKEIALHSKHSAPVGFRLSKHFVC